MVTASILFFAWISDKYRLRALFIAIQTIMTLVGLVLTGFSSSSAWRYIANKILMMDTHPMITQSSNNIVSHSKRAVSSAMIISFGGIGGIFATTVFRQEDSPRYLPGIYATIACQLCLLALLALMSVYFWRQNKKILSESGNGRQSGLTLSRGAARQTIRHNDALSFNCQQPLLDIRISGKPKHLYSKVHGRNTQGLRAEIKNFTREQPNGSPLGTWSFSSRVSFDNNLDMGHPQCPFELPISASGERTYREFIPSLLLASKLPDMTNPQPENLSCSDFDAKELYNDSSMDSVKLEQGKALSKDAAFEGKTMRFVDWRILPLLALLYSFALIDRINIGAAYTAGMGADLGLSEGARYSIATCLYFVPYVLFQLPGNLVLRKFGVRNWLTFTVVAWGAVQLGMGFVTSWHALTAARVLLGAFEASFFPAMVYIISTWYKRHEVQKRLAVFYLIAITMGGIGPILAYVFSLLDGKRGIRGWSWIFIIEGTVTLFLGVVAWFFVPDFPDKNRFLTPKQTALVLRRIEEDRGDSIPDQITVPKVLKHLSDWTLWSYGIMFMCSSMPAYAQAYFLTLILKGLGWSKTASMLLSAPPYFPAIATTMFFSWMSDRTRHRGGFIVIQSLICLVGICLTAFSGNGHIRYFGVFLLNAGNSGTIPGILAYASNNVVSQSKRSVQSALTVSMGGIGGIIASTVYRAEDAPRYLPGLGVTIGTQCVLILLVGITHIHFRRLNSLARAGKLKKPLEDQPGFLYTL
ncbi:hypothetical protein H0H93_007471 [Arthromyces matolae]|nr:hypothetical protein H0H93_007471 [Arthromyces matolae]